MKKLIFVLTIVGVQICNSQIVDIPDANFKNLLVNTNCASFTPTPNFTSDVDTNDDGEIQVAEASLVIGLMADNANISSMVGIEAFTGLTSLYCSGNSIASMDVSALSLLNLDCENSGLSTLILNETSPPTDLRLAGNNLTSLNFLHPGVTMFILSVSNNPLTSLNLALDGVEYFDCDSTQLTELDLSEVRLGTGTFAEVSISNNPNLQFLNLKNGYIDACTEDNPSECLSEVYNYNNNPQLQFICVDENELEYFPGASTYCTFEPGGNFNTTSGTITYDSIGDGCTVSDIPVSGIMMGISQGATLGVTSTLSNGTYHSYVFSGNQVITPQPENPYFTFSPPSFTSSFSGSGNTQTANFCLVANGVHPDLEVTILPIVPAMPGFNAKYRIICKNKGTELQAGTLNFYFDDALVDFVSSSPIGSQAVNTVSWGFLDLAPFEVRTFDVVLNVNSPMETPAVNINDILAFSATVDSGIDETPSDNTGYFSQVVVGSYDPNDKTVLEGSSITWMQFDNYLHYLVRFQNTGTAAATNVVIQDMLSANLNLSTLELLSASHDFRSTLSNGNKLEFFFENINLPAESVDEPGSHGYVAFKIKPAESITQGDIIENTAEIYFDFNFPIVTNTVVTTVSMLSVNEMVSSKYAVYPNPARNSFSISINENDVVESISVYDMMGQLVKSMYGNIDVTHIPVSDLQSGTYMIEIKSTLGIFNKRLIKL